MKKFKYSARDSQGKEVSGKIEAKDMDALAEILHDRGLIVVSIKDEFTIDWQELAEINIGGIPMKDKVVFMRQMATMVSSGLPLTRALEIMEQQVENPAFKKIVAQVKASVESGESLSDSFRQAGEVFDDVSLNLIEAGESSGNLDIILTKLATELEESKKLGDKLRGALIYPIIILVVIIAVVAMLMFVLVPSMADIYADFGAELPWVTTFLINMSNFAVSYWWAVILTVAVVVIGGKAYLDTQGGKRNKDKLMLKMPIVGTIVTKMQLAQFTRLLALLLGSGLPIIRALELTAQSLSNQMFRDVILASRDDVERGGSLAIPIARSEYFPLLVSSMIAVGEETGELDSVLNKVAEYYKEEVDVATSSMSTILEPVFLIVMGVVIAFIALAVYMPMFQLSEVMSMVVDIASVLV
jgi:type IV pilus assembly protein PilC